jgi:hypothetical protein
MSEATEQPLDARELSPEELLGEEARSRAVGLVSMLTVFCLSFSFFCLYMVQRDAAQSGGDVAALLLIDAQKGWYIASYFFLAIGSLLVGPVLMHILIAAKSRMPSVSKFALYAAVAGPVLVAIALPAFTLVQVGIAGDFAAGSVQTVEEAKRLLGSTAFEVTTGFYRVALLVFAIAWAVTGVYGMRTGLLTRLIGVVALAIGGANIFAPPLAAIVQVFWIGAVSIMLMSRGGNKPPAWVLGRSVPWSEVQANAELQRAEEQPAIEEPPAVDAPAEEEPKS